MRMTTRMRTAAAAAVALIAACEPALGQTTTIPDRPTAPLFKARSDGERAAEMNYDAGTGTSR